MLMAEYSPPNVDPLFPPPPLIHIPFPLAFLHFPQGDTPYSSIPLPQAWLVVGAGVLT